MHTHGNRAVTVLAMVLVTVFLVAASLLAGGRPAAADAADLLRLNVGGPAYVDSQGLTWQADSGTLCPGQVLTTSHPISGTPAGPLYRDGRFSFNMLCRMAVPEHLYRVELKFAELYWQVVGQRGFDILIEQKMVRSNMDIIALAGAPFTASDFVDYVNVVDGYLEIQLLASTDTALLNALRITPVDSSPTATATITRTPTNTHTPSQTATSTLTATATRTPTNTRTPTITPTPTFTVQYVTTFQRGVLPDIGYTGADDTYIVDDQPDSNRHAQQGLYLHYFGYDTGKAESELLLRFAVDGAIPANALVGAATLSLYVAQSSNANQMEAGVFDMRTPWSAAEATWNRPASASLWDVPGANGPNDRAQSATDALWFPWCTGSLTCGWQDFDVTALAQRWISDPGSNFGMLIKAIDRQGNVEYTIHSSFYPFNDTLRPKLSILWTIPATPVATSTATATTTAAASATATRTAAPGSTATQTSTVTPTPTFANAQSAVFQQGVLPSLAYNGADDVTIDQGHPSQTHFGQSWLYVAQPAGYVPPSPDIELESLLKFDLRGYIPTDAVIGTAILSFNVTTATNATATDFRLFGMIRPWMSTSATWNDAYIGLPWEIPGAYGAGDRYPTPVAIQHFAGCANFVECNQWIDFDVTTLAQQWAGLPEENWGVLIQARSQFGRATYSIASSDYFLIATLRPRLSVTWTVPEPTATVTPSATATATAAATETSTSLSTKTPSLTPTNTGTASPTRTTTPTATVTHVLVRIYLPLIVLGGG